MSALTQGSKEWHELRRNMIGASDAPIIMGISPWSTPFQLWEKKVGIKEDITNPNKNQQYGIDTEPEARQLFTIRTGITVKPDVMFSNENKFMMASLDGIDELKQNIVEIKCPGAIDHETAKQGKIPDKYYPQLQHQLSVCQLDMSYYYSYRKEENQPDDVLIKVYRDDTYIKNMISIEKDFWDCINEFIAPSLSEKDYQTKDDEMWKYTANQWLNIKKQLDRLEDKEKKLRDLLISFSDNTNSVGSGVRVSKIIRKGPVDYTSITEIKDVDLDKHRKPAIESWRITGV